MLICLNKYITNLKISSGHKNLFKNYLSTMKKEQTLLLEMENTKAKFKNSADIFSSRLDLKKKMQTREDRSEETIHPCIKKKRRYRKKKNYRKKKLRNMENSEKIRKIFRVPERQEIE